MIGKIVSDNMRVLRSKNHLSQREVAEKIGVHVTSYTAWEKDASKVKISAIERLAKLYGVSIDVFFAENIYNM